MAFELEVQKSLYLALDALGLTVYDIAPQSVDGGADGVYPYVEVGAIVVGEWDTKSNTGFDFVARLHTYSNTGGMAEAKGIQGQMYARLHLGELDISGYSLTLLRRESSNVIGIDDNIVHGVCEYRGLVETS